MKIDFHDFNKFPTIYYSIDVNWRYLQDWVDQQMEIGCGKPLDVNPEFQRGHVWTKKQKIAYIEFCISGGSSGQNLYFNHPGWMSDYEGDFVLVDGLQRISAVLDFMQDKIKAFGHKYSESTGKLPDSCKLKINIAKLKSKKDVMQWYINMNAGGTPHAKKEIQRVQGLMNEVMS